MAVAQTALCIWQWTEERVVTGKDVQSEWECRERLTGECGEAPTVLGKSQGYTARLNLLNWPQKGLLRRGSIGTATGQLRSQKPPPHPAPTVRPEALLTEGPSDRPEWGTRHRPPSLLKEQLCHREVRATAPPALEAKSSDPY